MKIEKRKKFDIHVKRFKAFAMLKVLALVLLSCMLISASATNYYFSSTGGNDSNSGLSPSGAKKSVSEIQKILSGINPGDTIFLERGSVWYQTQIYILSKAGTPENPIVFDAYGTGENPVFSGLKILDSPVRSGSIFTFTDSAIPAISLNEKSYGRRVLGYVTIGGRPYQPSRHPNEGYFMATASNRISVTDNKQNWEDDQWLDGWVALKSVKWQWSLVRVISNTLNSANTTDHAPYPPYGVRPYFFINALSALDLNGEWYWTDNKLSVYWSSDELPEVKVPVVDQIFTINNSNYIRFSNIDFVGANLHCVSISRSDYNKFYRCRFIGAGEFGIRIFGKEASPGQGGDSENNEITFSEIADCGLGGIFSRYARGGNYSNNYVHRIAIHPGYQNKSENNSTDGYAIAVWNNVATSEMPVVRQNFIDSVQAGVTNHYNATEFLMTENFIRNYGIGDLSDLGGLYIVSDPSGISNKRMIYKNFFIDVHEPHPQSQITNYSDSYIHAVYFDQDSYSVKADSNSIENAQIALNTNGGKFRTFNHNNILNPVIHTSMLNQHRAAIANSYIIELNNGSKAESDTFMHNNIVFDANGEIGYKFSRPADSYGCLLSLKGQIDFNSWFDPHNSSPFVAAIFDTYSPQSFYTLNQWQALSTNCSDYENDPGDNSTFDKFEYQDVKLFKNWSSKSHTFQLDADYVDKDGKVVTDSVSVPAFYSKLLFKVYGEESNPDLFIDSTLVPEPAAPPLGRYVITSSPENIKTTDIGYYPNPVTDFLNLTNLPPECEISLFGITGKKLLEINSGNTSIININLQELSEGLYMVSIKKDFKTVKSFKIIKN